ncbi:MAG: AraC family transcriptional regulator ligand-binding domain-containing protein [Halioglobus sp.]
MAVTIPLRYAQSLLRLAPMPEDQLRQQLAELNLPLVLLQTNTVADARIPVEDYGRLFIHLVHTLQQDLPSHSGDVHSTLLFSTYRMMFQAMLHAGNLEQAMQRASVYFQRLQPNGETFHLEQVGEMVCCHFDFSSIEQRPLAAPENFSMEQLNWLPGVTGQVLSMAMWHRVCGWFIGSFIQLSNVEMTQGANPRNNYTDVFGTPVQFSAQRDGFYFHSRYLQFPIVQSETSLAAMLATYPAELLKISPDTHGVGNKVKQLIGKDFQRALPSLQDVADRLHMTTPTLHRRLREEGTSFQQLKDQCRKFVAIDYLSSGDYTTAQLAELMGFSDSSTFHRAFKNWTGMTPQAYRQRNC